MQRRPGQPTARGDQGHDLPACVERLARNLWWTWNSDATRLFAALDPALWEASNHDPLRTLAGLAPERRAALAGDKQFLALLGDCERQLAEYLKSRTWFERTFRGRDRRLLVAYFCSEYALHESLPQYAGGLGVLAGDHLKSASDLGVPLVAVGLLYRCGYYRQELRPDGTTRAVYPRYDFRLMPLEDTRRTVSVPLGRRTLHARVWRLRVGRTHLLLLDADVPRNRPEDRRVTEVLYVADPDRRMQQYILLGVGGVRALDALGYRPTVFHLNEGHAALCGLERVRQLVAAGRTFDAALNAVRATSVFTTHTPVPAGHDRYPPRLVMKHLGPLADELGLSRDEFLGLGRESPRDRREPLCMTVLALRLSGRCNAVSKLNGDTTRRMWMRLFGASSPDEVPIGHVTNGVHSQTWLAPEIEPLHARYLGPRWIGAGPGDDWWKRAGRIPPAELWAARRMLRRRLVDFVRRRLRQQALRRSASREELLAAEQAFDENALTIGFARRFATYKRAPLIFHDRRRLARILNDPQRPVQIVFAGKAHPADREGQKLVQMIYRYSQQPEFRGRVALIEEYDLHVGRVLTSGCDVWLNNPLRPMEASGTSGMKPPLHGGLNCSILDGWWPEAYEGRNGWAIRAGPQRSRAAQDRADAAAIYELLERQIVPLFYARDRAGLPRRWIRRMRASMKSICGRFSAHRMLGEYVRDYYLPAHRGHHVPGGRLDGRLVDVIGAFASRGGNSRLTGKVFAQIVEQKWAGRRRRRRRA